MFITPMAPMGDLSGIKPIDTARTFLRHDSEGVDPRSGGGIPFKDIFETAVQNLIATERTSNDDTALLALGDIDDLHTLGIDATKAGAVSVLGGGDTVAAAKKYGYKRVASANK